MKFMMYLQLFAHAHQERWSSLVDKKLRQTLVTRDNYIFSTKNIKFHIKSANRISIRIYSSSCVLFILYRSVEY